MNHYVCEAVLVSTTVYTWSSHSVKKIGGIEKIGTNVVIDKTF